MGFGGVSVSDSFISQLGQDVVRGHFLLSFPIPGEHGFWKEFYLCQGSSLTTTARSTLKPSTNLLLPRCV